MTPETPQVKSYKKGFIFKRNISNWSRWLHIYLSMISFFVLFFFAVTGLTLNHTEWFTSQQHTQSTKGKVDPKWVNTPDSASVARLEIVEFMRKTHNVKGAMTEFTTDEYQCTVSFNGPGYTADVFINREDGVYDFSETTTGAFGVMNDLHKGRDSGNAWSLLIDISAVLMVVVSLTGLVMLFFLKKKRVAGLVLIIVGILLVYLVYAIWVP